MIDELKLMLNSDHVDSTQSPLKVHSKSIQSPRKVLTSGAPGHQVPLAVRCT